MLEERRNVWKAQETPEMEIVNFLVGRNNIVSLLFVCLNTVGGQWMLGTAINPATCDYFYSRKCLVQYLGLTLDKDCFY